MSDLGEWDDEPEISDQPSVPLKDGEPEAQEVAEPGAVLQRPSELRAGTSFPVLSAQPQRNRPNVVPVVVETRRSHQSARSAMAVLGIPPPRRLHRHELVVGGTVQTTTWESCFPRTVPSKAANPNQEAMQQES